MFEEKEQQNGFPGSALMVNGGWLMAKAKEERRRKKEASWCVREREIYSP